MDVDTIKFESNIKEEMDLKDDDFNFSAFSAKCSDYFDQNPINLRELCVPKSVLKPADFLKSLEENMEAVAPISSNKVLGTVEEYAELFKVFDTYPSNLQRLPKKREHRAHTTINKGNDTVSDHASINTSSASLAASISRLDEQQSAAKVYNDYKKFQQQLRQIHDESIALEKERSAYLSKITQLENFARQLGKLLPAEREAPNAYTVEEQEMLNTIAENMQQLNYIRTHNLSDLNLASAADNIEARLEILIDVLNYTLMQISCYNSA